jgi:hypothetical protein
MTGGGFRVFRTQTAPADPGNGYQLTELGSLQPITTVTWTGAASYQYNDLGPSNGVTYYYVVVPFDAINQSAIGAYPFATATPVAPPATVTISVANPNINAGSPPLDSRLYLDGTLTIVARAPQARMSWTGRGLEFMVFAGGSGEARAGECHPTERMTGRVCCRSASVATIRAFARA